MPVNKTMRLDAITFGAPDLTFTQIDDADVSAGLQTMLEQLVGEGDNTFRATTKQEASVRFTTSQLATLLAAVPVNGVCGTTCTMYFAQANCTGKAARNGGTHRSVLAQEFLLFWESISLPDSAKGTARVVAHLISDGVNPYLTSSATANLPALTAPPKEYFGCGPFFLNGTRQVGLQSMEIESGVRHTMRYAECELTPTAARVNEWNPTVRLTTLEPTAFDGAVTDTGIVLDGTDGFRAFARRYSEATDRFPELDTEHIKIEATHGAALPQNVSGSGVDDTTDTVLIEPLRNPDLSQDLRPLILTPGQAIA